MINFLRRHTTLNAKYKSPPVVKKLTSFILTYDVDTPELNSDTITSGPACGGESLPNSAVRNADDIRKDVK